ncbi:MAG: VRR-NUC domain-containing protein [Bacteroidales bacterium]|nr:VRR-NUC domain-containing protein [Bacteroidales bacterium]
MKDVEHKTQVACVRWFRLQYPQLASVLFAVPNGGRRDAVTGAKLKAEGALAGVADIFLDVDRGEYHGLRIEMKTKTGRLSDSQKAFSEAETAQGYLCKVCRGFDEFRDTINEYLSLCPPTSTT